MLTDGRMDERMNVRTDGNLHAYVFLKQVRQKVTKFDPTIISNPHAHPHTMRKTHAKFQNNWYKNVRGVALTRDTLCLYNQGEKWLSSQCRKSDKNWSNNYVKSTCTSSYHEENTCKVSKPEFRGQRCRTCPPLHSHPHKKVMIISGRRNKCGNLIESTWIFSFVA